MTKIEVQSKEHPELNGVYKLDANLTNEASRAGVWLRDGSTEIAIDYDRLTRIKQILEVC